MTRVSPASIALIALIVLFTGCTGTDRPADQSKAPEARPAAPHTVEDFYKNSEFFGASWAPDNQKILVSSNLSGIWNAYAVPVGGGPPEPLTRSTTDSIFALRIPGRPARALLE